MAEPVEPSNELVVPGEGAEEVIVETNPRAERLWALNQEHGSTAHDPQEINHMYHLYSVMYQSGGAKEYVRRIATSRARHAYEKPIEEYEEMTRRIFHPLSLAYQIGAQYVDPEGKAEAIAKGNKAAVESVEKTTMHMADTFLGYLDDAQHTIVALNELDRSLSGDDVDQSGKLDKVDIEDMMEHSESAKRAIGAITRYVEGYLFSNDAGEDYTKTDYMSTNADVVAREIETVGEIDIAFLRQIIALVRDLELTRKKFWDEQLRGHGPDRESGIGARAGMISINIDGLKDHIERSMLDIYRGAYSTSKK